MNSALDEAERICGGYIVPAVCLFGIACNAVNMIVLTRRQLRGSPYIYLLGLAVTDMSVLTLSVLESAICKPFGQGVYFWQVRASLFLQFAVAQRTNYFCYIHLKMLRSTV